MSDLATPLLDELTIEDGWLSTEPREKWAEYERQKRHIAEWSRSAAEYERRVKELADKLGV